MGMMTDQCQLKVRTAAATLRLLAASLDVAVDSRDVEPLVRISNQIGDVDAGVFNLWSDATDEGFAEEDREYAKRQATRVLPFPSPEVDPYRGMTPHFQVSSARARALHGLATGHARVLIASVGECGAPQRTRSKSPWPPSC